MPSSTSSRTYSLLEPHPHATPRAYLATGRGGAGNYTRAPSNLTSGATAQGPPSRIHLSSISSAAPRSPSTSDASTTGSSKSRSSSSTSGGFHSGRGGAGNVHPSTERAIFSFDEELERQMGQERRAAPVYHVGRGGAGNVYASSGGAVTAYPKAGRRSGSESEGDDRRSEKSVGSVDSGADVATRAVGRAWKKMVGGH
ncbi:uncharacterized protein HMPREF1541_03486 [Cyphellophora europaea CBS 101466]|uniref:Uncharacterized protein n=1 Tax=Cyphellophora europaea (strain CBS 101466) TaxID=1220924 RepID=W2RYZ2_CYPE1|nr:uncharacterized protein HMPREF1541_03486 [Cyphellophora europaea CBS 101466]ETN41550.1 hypothetical protein HMPREF1541_03486 [Cyphellophora europaea CBS 101466]